MISAGSNRVPFLVVLTAIGAGLMFVPAVHAFALRDYDIARPFFYGGAVFLAVAAMMALASGNRPHGEQAKGHLAALIGAYLLLPLMLAVPFHQVIGDTTMVDAWFEMVSSLTTTGATVYDPPSRLHPSLHLWRALIGWVGGLFILVAALAILTPLNLGGAEVLTGRAPGLGRNDVRIADPSERLWRQFLTVLPVYAGLTAVLWALLTMAGDSGFVALCHAMSTMASSGISPIGGVIGSGSGFLGEAVVFFFLFFAVSRGLLPMSWGPRGARGVWRDPELRMALGIVMAVTVALFLRRAVDALEPGSLEAVSSAFRMAWGIAFTTLSFLTTTGFVSAEWAEAQAWTGLSAPGLLLSGLAMMGGGVATTAGGIKLLRVYALLRHGERQLELQVHPSSVGGGAPVARRLRSEGAYLAWIFFILFGLAIAAVTGLLTLTGQEFEPALLFAIASLSNTGLLPSGTGSGVIGFAQLDSVEKVVCAVAMVVGRVETLAILVLLTPDRWRD